MNKNVMAIPNWAKEILGKLEYEEIVTEDCIDLKLYCGVSPRLSLVVSKEEDHEGKPIYLVGYSRIDYSGLYDETDKDYVMDRLRPLLGEPVNCCTGDLYDYIEYNRKVN